ncbi:MAG: D-glycero-beta-D-manno-heptose-7-phosphate kinase [Nitrospirota bacterium]|nr:D-glycero-beta-D-manno-heptose-7-phosphate kinase [Nitrospirota bacterium]
MGTMGPAREKNQLGKGGAQSRTLQRHIERFPQARVLVLGDLILDHYIWGKVSRISPEAPVPVVHVSTESLQLGGAANVYHNILALGGHADICGVVGADEGGRRLLKELGMRRQGRGGVVIDPGRPTTRKTRVLAHNQQVVRFDVEQRSEIKAPIQRRIIRYVESRLREISCLVVSDYAKGVVTATLMGALTRLAALRRIPLVVDPKVEHLSYYKGATVVTPNHLEAVQGAGLHREDEQSVFEAGEILRQRLGCQCVIVTRGEKGVSGFEADGSRWHIPAMARQVYDVTGAGDTIVGTLALALATGASIRDGAVLANRAAGLVVGMVGTGTVTAQQLSEALTHG